MRTVLLVDDHVLFRESLALLLRQRLPELRVLEAGSLHLALRQCERHPDIDLIVLDLMLRDSRGVLTLERLRRACPGTAVVVVSGATEAGLALELRRLGASAFCRRRSARRICWRCCGACCCCPRRWPPSIASRCRRGSARCSSA